MSLSFLIFSFLLVLTDSAVTVAAVRVLDLVHVNQSSLQVDHLRERNASFLLHATTRACPTKRNQITNGE